MPNMYTQTFPDGSVLISACQLMSIPNDASGAPELAQRYTNFFFPALSGDMLSADTAGAPVVLATINTGGVGTLDIVLSYNVQVSRNGANTEVAVGAQLVSGGLLSNRDYYCSISVYENRNQSPNAHHVSGAALRLQRLDAGWAELSHCDLLATRFAATQARRLVARNAAIRFAFI